MGLAVANELLNIPIPAFDVFTVATTLTVFADPMFIETIDPTQQLLNFAGPLPDFSIVGSVPVPEPSTLLLAGPLLLLLLRGRRRLPQAPA